MTRALAEAPGAVHRPASACRGAPAALAEPPREPPPDARPEAFGHGVATLAQQAGEPLAAIANYLLAARRLLAAQDPAAMRRLDEAIGKATEQTLRAAGIVRRLARLPQSR